jgi:hypothetical protein
MEPTGGSVADEISQGIRIFVADFLTKFPSPCCSRIGFWHSCCNL